MKDQPLFSLCRLQHVAGEKFRRQHAFEDSFERHRVGAGSVAGREEITGAMPVILYQCDLVVAVFTVECHRQVGDLHPGSLASVKPGFFHFPDDAGVHRGPS